MVSEYYLAIWWPVIIVTFYYCVSIYTYFAIYLYCDKIVSETRPWFIDNAIKEIYFAVNQDT